ncbi:glycosyltransferase [Acinetobacter sp. ANC 4779]|uniref:glycosyltransferase n=1 Tax=Acinetobacter sp. ANC 4779 TaxID=2529848 RepID=UPI00103A7906|nr:glycosyltransferase [Acinetobacter sp. ANC 4779]TCB50730.1 glycosyltransferase [Acinetobacter sp. ANC 4779]
MIGIVIPACNEEQYLEKCLHHIRLAIQALPTLSQEVRVLVVLDSCNDQSLEIVQNAGVEYLQCNFGCVGKARDLGVRHLIDSGATWIACTDADTWVDTQWLLQQINHQPADAICGVVEVDSWQNFSILTRKNYLAHYQDVMNHPHIHGANLSFSSNAYLQTGGFEALCCHEDVDLIQRMLKLNLKIIWSNLVRVKTSSRLNARAPEGFSSFLHQLEIASSPIK